MKSHVAFIGRPANDVDHGDGTHGLETQRQIFGGRFHPNELPDNTGDDAFVEPPASGDADALADPRRFGQFKVQGRALRPGNPDSNPHNRLSPKSLIVWTVLCSACGYLFAKAKK
jgi:hypothetical protein